MNRIRVSLRRGTDFGKGLEQRDVEPFEEAQGFGKTRDVSGVELRNSG